MYVFEIFDYKIIVSTDAECIKEVTMVCNKTISKKASLLATLSRSLLTDF